MSPLIGITTTVPVEIILAAGAVPVDLNNVFVTASDRAAYISRAERDGYPRSVCAWIKGMYGVLAERDDIRTVVAVTQGDCSNTHALMETLHLRGVGTIPFAYPYSRGYDDLEREMRALAERLGTTLDAAERMRAGLEPVRCALDRLDGLTWSDGLVTGAENHLYLVQSSDFNGDPASYGDEVAAFLDKAEARETSGDCVRLAYIGVPPILDDIYDVLATFGARVVFNEVQRQFSMPRRDGDIVEQYLAYTYPYDIFHRLDYIGEECVRRGIDGIIHYVQSFCHRHIGDLVVRNRLDLPVLTVEGESPGHVDERTRIRLQAFVEMLEQRKSRR